MSISSGLRRLNSQITINASAEDCYKAWVNTSQIPVIMQRVQGLEVKFLANRKPETITTSPDVIQASLQRFQNAESYAPELRRWLFSGPGGRLYEIENTTILEIPNYFYCTAPNDPNDFHSESCVFFIEDKLKHCTLVKWEITFRPFSPDGSWTQFALDLQQTEDHFMQDCLQDLKRFVEERGQPARH
jgi:hypothetical protein